MTHPQPIIRHTIHFAGRVQGVGFRYNAKDVALGFAVTGHVQNLSDGRVRLVAEGAAEELSRFSTALRKRMARYIEGESCEVEAATGEFTGFDVRR